MREAAKVLDDFAYGIIRQREADGLHTIVDGKALESEKKDLLSLYMELRDENGKPMSKVALRYVLLSPSLADSCLSDSVINLIIAGVRPLCSLTPDLTSFASATPPPKRSHGSTSTCSRTPSISRRYDEKSTSSSWWTTTRTRLSLTPSPSSTRYASLPASALADVEQGLRVGL